MAGTMIPLVPPPQLANTATLSSQVEDGPAIFSTHNGKVKKETAIPELSCVVVRDDPVADYLALAANIRSSYPNDCNAIIDPIGHVSTYFDQKDIIMHGEATLNHVLKQLAAENLERAGRIGRFADSWMQRQPERFQMHLDNNLDLNVFDEEDHVQYGTHFLFDVLLYLSPGLREMFRGELGT